MRTILSWRRVLAAATTILALTMLLSATALADGPVGKDPKHNVSGNFFPSACEHHSTGRVCEKDAIAYLNKGRKSLGEPKYRLPKNFLSLSPADQDLVLTDEDRALYHLAPVPGLTKQLDRSAYAGARAQEDPHPSFPEYTANWAGGLPNIIFAYGTWMYYDGWGSDNEDCTTPHAAGCWGHRHDVLFRMTLAGGPLGMGAAVDGASYAMTIAEGYRSYHPHYLYTWAQARKQGAR